MTPHARSRLLATRLGRSSRGTSVLPSPRLSPFVSVFLRHVDSLFVPRAPLGPRPSEHVQVSALRRARARLLVPRTSSVARPIEDVHVAAEGGEGADDVPREGAPVVDGPPITSRWPPSAAAAHARQFQGHARSRRRRKAGRFPAAAACSATRQCKGRPLSSAHRVMCRVTTAREAWSGGLPPGAPARGSWDASTAARAPRHVRANIVRSCASSRARTSSSSTSGRSSASPPKRGDARDRPETSASVVTAASSSRRAPPSCVSAGVESAADAHSAKFSIVRAGRVSRNASIAPRARVEMSRGC